MTFLSCRLPAAALAGTVLALAGWTGLRAQQLALRTFTARDGLAHGRVNCMVQDRRGYLWCGTWEGLCRFDGRRWTSYGTADGLPIPFVNCIVEDAAGQLWVGTQGGGVARMRELPGRDGRKFDAFAVAAVPDADNVFAIRFDGATIWLGTGAGWYRGVPEGGGFAFAREVAAERSEPVAFDDGAGLPCFLSADRLVRLRSGKAEVIPVPWERGPGYVRAVLADEPGRWLIAREGGLWQCTLPEDAAIPPALTGVSLPLRAGEHVQALAHGSGGELWVGTTLGLWERCHGEWRLYTVSQGLPDDWVNCLYRDTADNLWIGTWRGGLARLSSRAVSRYGPREGLLDANVSRMVASASGRWYAATSSRGLYEVRDAALQPVPGSDVPQLAGVHMRVLCDRRSDFWVGSDAGMWFVPGPEPDFARARLLGEAEGFPAVPVVAEIYQDRSGRIWCGTGDGSVYRREAEGTRWQRVVSLPELGDRSACRVFLVDADGSALLATYDHLWLWRDGTCEQFRLPGMPDGPLRPRSLLRDRRGWLWIGTRFHGAFVERPDASPRLVNFRAGSGLASDAIWSIAEDQAGRVYCGTARGVSRYDPANGTWRTFGADAGTTDDVVNHLCSGGPEVMWAGTSGGLLRLEVGAAENSRQPPRVYFEQVLVAGERLPLPEGGAEQLGELVLGPGEGHLVVGFVGVDLHAGGPLRFQHQLAGVDRDWSPETEDTAVHFANLAPGWYRLRVRAAAADGTASAPVELSFRVLPPLWQRSWFLASLGVLTGLLVWQWHRARLRRAVATERLRTGIATDLHDDLGAGLVQIAILSEVARAGASAKVSQNLSEVAGLARSLREAMTDIVWTMAPGRDRLADLVQRMRQLAERLLEVDGVRVEFRGPGEPALATALHIDQRRHLWLWFKEALTNVARHARAASVRIAVSVTDDCVQVEVADDGRGFDPALPREGNGLRNLEQRSRSLQGSMQLRSAPGGGTTLLLQAPLHPPRRRPA